MTFLCGCISALCRKEDTDRAMFHAFAVVLVAFLTVDNEMYLTHRFSAA